MQTPQVPALPGMTPLGLPTKPTPTKDPLHYRLVTGDSFSPEEASAIISAVNTHGDLVAAANQMVRVFHCHCDTEGCRQCAAHVEMSQILANLANAKVVRS